MSCQADTLFEREEGRWHWSILARIGHPHRASRLPIEATITIETKLLTASARAASRRRQQRKERGLSRPPSCFINATPDGAHRLLNRDPEFQQPWIVFRLAADEYRNKSHQASPKGDANGLASDWLRSGSLGMSPSSGGLTRRCF